MEGEVPKQIFCKPFDQDYYQYSFNMEKFHLIDRYEFKEFLRQRCSIPFKTISESVSNFDTFIIDNNENSLEVLTIREEDIKKEFDLRLKDKSNYSQKEEKKSWLDKVKSKSNNFSKFFQK